MLRFGPNLKQLVNDIILLYGIRFNNGIVPERYLYTTTIEISSTCNLRCPLCPIGANVLQRGRIFISKADFNHIYHLTCDRTREYILSMWGEPLLHPDLFYILDRLKNKTVRLSSNLNISHKKIERLSGYKNIVITGAVDTYSKEKYSSYRKNGNHARVVENLKILAKGKCQTKALIFFDRSDHDELKKNRDFVKTLGLEPEFVHKKVKNDNFMNRNIGIVKKNMICHTLLQGLYFTSNGYLVPCCKNTGQDLKLMHASKFKSLKQLEKDQMVVNMRRMLASNKNRFKSCQSCGGFVYEELVLRKFYKLYDLLNEKYIRRIT